MIWKIGKADPYALLAALLAEEKGMDALPPMARKAGGKPWFPARPDLSFSVSRSGELALCALGDRPLGADVEKVRNRTMGLPRYALSGAEYAWFEAWGGRWEDFYTLWTLKEARVKCTGEGLRRPAREVAVPLIGPGERAEYGGFLFTALAGEGWRGAVCEANS